MSENRVSGAVLWVATAIVFGAGAGRLGFYADDSGWMISLRGASLESLWEAMRTHVPGRNLHPLWHYLLYAIVGDPVAHLTALHLIQSAIDASVVVGFFLLLNLLGLPRHVAVIAAGLFSFWPLHGQTHFFPDSMFANLFSTLFVVLFAFMSLALDRGRRAWWLWTLDALVFLCALFTYDQVFLVLLGIAALRVVRARRWRFALAHLPYAAAAAFFVWLKLTIVPGSAPTLRSGLWERLQVNVGDTISHTVGRLGFYYVGPFYGQITSTDWVLALAAAVALTFLTLKLRPGPLPAARTRLWPLFLLALLFYLAAYLPIWLWWFSPRHHYLPSMGLFGGGAVALAGIFGRLGRSRLHVPLILVLGTAVFALAALNRGESRYWEQAFAAKRQLFAELETDLHGKEILVLEDFPASLGPAPLIWPQDAMFAGQLFHGPSLRLSPLFASSLSSAPAPGGIFLDTLGRTGPPGFRYYATDNALIARFVSWENRRLKYKKNPAGPPLYRVLAGSMTSQEGRFAIERLVAQRTGEGVTVSLSCQTSLRPHSYLTAVFSFPHGERFFRWGVPDNSGDWRVQPVLLSDPGPEPRSGAFQFDQRIRLDSFPREDRIQLELYEARRDHAPVLLGTAETAVEP